MVQQIKIKTGIVALFVFALVYAGCKKDSPSVKSPATVTATDKQASLAVVNNVVAIVTGGIGLDPANPGFVINSIGQQHNKLKVNDASSPGCGIDYDSTLNVTTKPSDTLTYTYKGDIKVTSSCNSGSSLASVNESTTFTLLAITPSLSANYNVAANITESLIAGDGTGAQFSSVLDGTESIAGKFNFTNGKSGTQSYSYNFHSITTDGTGIASGSVDYVAKVSGVFGSWNYSGTVTFLNSKQVKITLGGATYIVNLTTQEVDGEI